MLNFNERDLMQMCVAAGFVRVRTELHLNVGPVPAMNWDAPMRSSGNPLIPTNGEITGEIFSVEERERFEKHLRPIVSRSGKGFARVQPIEPVAQPVRVFRRPRADSRVSSAQVGARA